ncbi:MAG: DedA family protein [Betaproteobacteria bacterium]
MPDGFFEQLFAPILDLVREHRQWAPPIVFVLCFVESLAIVSAFLPATLLLLAIGSLAAAGVVSLLELAVWGTIGAGLGYWVSFEAGRRYGSRIESLGFFARRPEWIERGHRFFERWGSVAVLLSRFIPIGRAVIPLLAGAMGNRRASFQVANWLSAVLWAPLMLAPASIGVALADQLKDASPQTRAIVLIAIVVAVVAAVRGLRR